MEYLKGFQMLLVLLLTGLNESVANFNQTQDYEVVYPKQRINGAWSNDLSTKTKNTKYDGLHKKYVTFQLETMGRVFVLKLTLNFDILDELLTTVHVSSGNISFPDKKSMNFCFYGGKAFENENEVGMVAIKTCKGLDGYLMINDLHDTIVIQPAVEYSQSNRHIAYLGEKIRDEHPQRCITLNMPKIIKTEQDGPNPRKKRSVLSEVKYVEVMFVINYDLYSSFTENQLREMMFEYTNGMDCLFQPLNIRIVLSSVVFFDKQNLFNLSQSASLTLIDFALYRLTQLSNTPENSSWHRSDTSILLTYGDYIEYSGAGNVYLLGIAVLKQMCQTSSVSYASVMTNNRLPLKTTILLAHELGHVLGIDHDTASCVCEETYCIMNPFLRGLSQIYWSNCSKQMLNDQLELSTGSCLLNKPTSILPTVRCGNKWVEAGEECDCGTVEECKSLCCNPHTCKLWEFAECDRSACCDQNTCRRAPPGVPCRELCDLECDLPEYCDGENVTCPANRIAMDGTWCNLGMDRCKGGYCMTRDRQCGILFEGQVNAAAVNGDKLCYDLNRNGFEGGNCGATTNGSFIPCTLENKDCGKLYCDKVTDIRIGQSITSRAKTLSVSGHSCTYGYTAEIPGKDVYYVKDGTACNINGVCNKKVCEETPLNVCPNCSLVTGVCNDMGHCHCHPFHQGKNCSVFNPSAAGGGPESGPAPLNFPDCSGYNATNKWDTFSNIVSEINLNVTCGVATYVRLDLCPFIVRGCKVEDLALYDRNLTFNPMFKLQDVAPECIMQPEPFVNVAPPTGRIVISNTLAVKRCGSQVKTNGSWTTFTHQLRTIKPAAVDASNTIARSVPTFIIDIACTYDSKLTEVIKHRPILRCVLDAKISHTGSQVVQLLAYPTNLYTMPFSAQQPTQISAGQRIFVKAELKSYYTKLVLQLINCWVSSNPSPINDQYAFRTVHDGCAVSDALGVTGGNIVYNNCLSTHVKFSFLAFYWAKVNLASQEMYLHCQTRVCHRDTEDCSCPSCNVQRRRRSVTKESEFTSSLGPFTVKQ